jgi:FkbM family methyltransferase
MENLRVIIQNTVLRCLPKFISHNIIQRYISNHNNVSFSQEGEDLLLARYFEAVPSGFYVDIGAHHPTRFSNTYLFYLRGWTGINIEPNSNAISLFNEIRHHDKNLNYGVGNATDKLKYYCFNEAALNTFSFEQKNNVLKKPQYFVTEEKLIEVKRVEDILDNYLTKDQKIDFMNIDTEGYDLNVLQSNNWDKYRPLLVLVEDFEFSTHSFMQSPISRFMLSVEYEFYAKTVLTIIFKDKKQNV